MYRSDTTKRVICLLLLQNPHGQRASKPIKDLIGLGECLPVKIKLRTKRVLWAVNYNWSFVGFPSNVSIQKCIDCKQIRQGSSIQYTNAFLWRANLSHQLKALPELLLYLMNQKIIYSQVNILPKNSIIVHSQGKGHCISDMWWEVNYCAKSFHQLLFSAQNFIWLALIGRQLACEMPSEMQGCLQWVTALQMLSFAFLPFPN